MRKIVLAGLALVLAVSGCSTGASEPEQPAERTAAADLLSQHGLSDMDVSEVIDHLDRVPAAERSKSLMASVRTDQLLLTDESGDVALDLPEGKSYISIAPFVDQTHECFFHSLTTCLGEMGDEPVEVTITDSATGEDVIDEKTRTFDNGFVGFWVPRGISGTIEISSDSQSGSTDFSTKHNGATCITDLQLS
ncbi:CueP family metal-binding protein [Brevibacterium picturae]|uniref:CueP family metal-binding protein n=1 Tax=Brevibacterium picturae TaxID=260553 RepID=A0ABN2C843_9MICO